MWGFGAGCREEWPTSAESYELVEECGRGVSATVSAFDFTAYYTYLMKLYDTGAGHLEQFHRLCCSLAVSSSFHASVTFYYTSA